MNIPQQQEQESRILAGTNGVPLGYPFALDEYIVETQAGLLEVHIRRNNPTKFLSIPLQQQQETNTESKIKVYYH
jgi:hypothetical protein